MLSLKGTLEVIKSHSLILELRKLGPDTWSSKKTHLTESTLGSRTQACWPPARCCLPVWLHCIPQVLGLWVLPEVKVDCVLKQRQHTMYLGFLGVFCFLFFKKEIRNHVLISRVSTWSSFKVKQLNSSVFTYVILPCCSRAFGCFEAGRGKKWVISKQSSNTA